MFLSGPGGGKMALQGAPGGTFGCLRDDVLGVWDDSLAFPEAFAISDGNFFLSNSIYTNLH